MSGELQNILTQVDKLNKADQALLLKKLSSIVKDNPPSNVVKLSQISGLGSSIWHGVDIDNYIDSERQW